MEFWFGYRNLNRHLRLKLTNVNFPLLWIWHYWCMASLTFLWSIPLDHIVQQFEVFCILENVTLIFLQTVQLFMCSFMFQKSGRMGASVLVFHPRISLCKLKSYSNKYGLWCILFHPPEFQRIFLQLKMLNLYLKLMQIFGTLKYFYPHEHLFLLHVM